MKKIEESKMIDRTLTISSLYPSSSAPSGWRSVRQARRPEK